MLHFEDHTLSIKKVMFPMKSSKKFFKYNIYGVNFDSEICISMHYVYVKECKTPTKFYTSDLIFCVKTGINGPLYREICRIRIALYVYIHSK